MMSRRSTLQNASLKEPSEGTEYPWRKSIPAEELTTDSVPLPVGPIAMWQAAMITSYDMMMIEFTSDISSWNILPRTKHTSVARMFVRDQPQSVRFMIIVSDPLNLPQREVIRVTREVTETTNLICSPQAPLEMVLMRPLSPRPNKKPLIGQTHADRANVGKIDKANAEIVALRDDKSDVAKGTESQINDDAKTERDKAAEAKTDVVAESETGEVPQECDSKTNVQRSTEAPQQTQQSQQPSSSTCDAGTSAQQTAQQVVDVPVTTDAGKSVQRTVGQVVHVPVSTEAGAGVQRTVEQIIDVPGDVEELAQQQPVEKIVSVAHREYDRSDAHAGHSSARRDATSATAREGQGCSERRSTVRVPTRTHRTPRMRACPLHGAGQTALQARQRALGRATATSFARLSGT